MRKKKFLFTILSICLFMIPLFAKADVTFNAWASTTKTIVGGTVTYVFDTSRLSSFSIEIKFDSKVLQYIPNDNGHFSYNVSDGVVTIIRAYGPVIEGYEIDLTVAEFKVLSVPNGGKARIEASIINPMVYSFEQNKEMGTLLSLAKINSLDVVITDEIKECPKCEKKECPTINDDSTSTDEETKEDELTDETDNGKTEDDSNVSAENSTSSNDYKDIVLFAALGSNVLLAGVVVTLLLRNKKKNDLTQIQK